MSAEEQAEKEGHLGGDQSHCDPQSLTSPYSPPPTSNQGLSPRTGGPPQPAQQYVQPPYPVAPARPPAYSGSRPGKCLHGCIDA